MMLSSGLGSIRYSICYRVGIVGWIHRWLSRFSTQVGVALIGIQFCLLSFPNSSFCLYLSESFDSEENWSPIEKTLFLIVGCASILHIQHIDTVVPCLFGVCPIIVVILVNGINIFITGIFAVVVTAFAMYQFSLPFH